MEPDRGRLRTRMVRQEWGKSRVNGDVRYWVLGGELIGHGTVFGVHNCGHFTAGAGRILRKVVIVGCRGSPADFAG